MYGMYPFYSFGGVHMHEYGSHVHPNLLLRVMKMVTQGGHLHEPGCDWMEMALQPDGPVNLC